MQQEEIVFVEVTPASNPHTKSAGIEALAIVRELGYKNVVLARAPEDYEPNIIPHVDEWIVCDTQDPDAIVRAVDQRPVKALLTFSEYFVGKAAAAARALGLPGPTPTSATLQRDKSAVRASLDRAGLPNPRWATASLVEPITTSPIGYPCIVKPIDGGASWDVMRVCSDAELQEILYRHLARKEYGRKVKPKHIVLFEEEIEGPLFSVEGFSLNTEAIIWGYSDRVLSNPPFFVEACTTFSSVVPHPGVPQFTRDVLAALRYDFGPFHLEFILSQDGPRLVEFNPRLIGGRAYHRINQCCNANVLAYIIQRYLGETPDELLPFRASTQRDIYTPCEGILMAIRGIEKAQAQPGLIELSWRLQIGDRVVPASSNDDLLGYIITVGSTAEESAQHAEQILSLLEIEIQSYSLGNYSALKETQPA